MLQKHFQKVKATDLGVWINTVVQNPAKSLLLKRSAKQANFFFNLFLTYFRLQLLEHIKEIIMQLERLKLKKKKKRIMVIFSFEKMIKFFTALKILFIVINTKKLITNYISLQFPKVRGDGLKVGADGRNKRYII